METFKKGVEMNTVLQVTKIKPDLLGEIKDSFNSLPKTDHADGNYRLRKYSHVGVSHKMPSGETWPKSLIEINDLNVNAFTQSSKYNKHQGGMKRNFDGIDKDVLNSTGMRELANVFRESCKLADHFAMDIHQMRVKCLGGATQLSPEGWHQDGYDHVAIIGVDRNNIIGGEILLSTSKTEVPFLQAVIETGTMVIIDDSYLWHNGRSIQPVDDDKPAWMDVLVFTLKL